MIATDIDKLTVERRLGRVRALLVALQCVANTHDDGIAVGAFCADLEMMAQEELTKVQEVLGVEVLDRDC